MTTDKPKMESRGEECKSKKEREATPIDPVRFIQTECIGALAAYVLAQLLPTIEERNRRQPYAKKVQHFPCYKSNSLLLLLSKQCAP